MKQNTDPRHQHRVEVMKSLFSFSFDQDTIYQAQLAEPIKERLDEIDSIIKRCAPEWPIDQINRIDLSILRLSIYELLERDTPYKVVIDEAVELAKEYGSENSPKFINGVLGSALEDIRKEDGSATD